LAAVNSQDSTTGTALTTGTTGAGLRIYANRSRQWLVAGSLLAVFGATLSLVFEPDPSTGVKPLPGDYLWVVIPGSIVLMVLVWRAFKARVETDGGGVHLWRTVGHEFFPWSDVRGFEVLPTPSRQGSSVRIRRQNETLVTVRSEINVRPLRDRDQARQRARQRAVAFRDQLAADRKMRIASGRRPPGATRAAGAPAPGGTTGGTSAGGSSGTSAGGTPGGVANN
jgi:hypothetical protein